MNILFVVFTRFTTQKMLLRDGTLSKRMLYNNVIPLDIEADKGNTASHFSFTTFSTGFIPQIRAMYTNCKNFTTGG